MSAGVFVGLPWIYNVGERVVTFSPDHQRTTIGWIVSRWFYDEAKPDMDKILYTVQTVTGEYIDKITYHELVFIKQ